MADTLDRPKFKVKKWSAVAVWSWKISVDNCAICRNHIMDLCIECQVSLRPLNPLQATSTQDSERKTDQDSCTISWGACGHAFHLHCISRWLKTRHVCPLDNTRWDFKPDDE